MVKEIRESHEWHINTFKPYRLTRKTIIFLQVLLFVFISARAYAVEVDGIYYLLDSSSRTAEVTYKTTAYNSYSGSVTIPEKFVYEGVEYAVTSIGMRAFRDCGDLTTVTIPNSVCSIGAWAFRYCRNLTSVNIPVGVTSIGQETFRECSSLTSIVIPNTVTDIGPMAFEDCSGLTSMNIPNSVTCIGKDAFRDCYGLTSVTIPSSVTSIGESAFSGCRNLTSITIPNSVTSIVSGTFYGCMGLTSMNIPNSIISIGSYAFYGCTGLTSVTIPSSVTSIGEYAFYSCTRLAEIHSMIIEPFETGNNCWDGVGKNIPLYVPAGSKTKYQATTGWKLFTNIIETSSAFILTIQAGNGGTISYNGTSISGSTSDFSIKEGTSATITISPNTGYQLSKLTVNGTDETSSVKNNSYTISNITGNTSIVASFIPITYTLSITVSGNGSASYSGTTVRGRTTSFTVDEGTSAAITFTPDDGYRIASVKVGSTDVTSRVSSNKYTISNITANTTVTVTFEAIPPVTYTLNITASGNGSASYAGTTIRGRTTSFTVDEGSSVTITFTPDTGYRIASVKVGSTDVTSRVSNNKYTISNITANTTVSVTFEAIPPVTYTLNITASGSGSASYAGTTVRGRTTSFTVDEGSSVTITFTPDTGYRIASVKVGSTDVTSRVSNNKYTISNITANTTVTVTFEAIPPTTYTLSITASGNGSAEYGGTSVKNKTTSFTVTEGDDVTITFKPDKGYRVASVWLNNKHVTSSVSNNKYTIKSISEDATVNVAFEEIPATTYTLSITSTGEGSVEYDGSSVSNGSQTFTLYEGASALLKFTPAEGHRLASLHVNNVDVTANVTDSQYVIDNITMNTTVMVVFEENPKELVHEGINYTVLSYSDKTLSVAKGIYGQVLTVPASFTTQNATWNVAGMDAGALNDSKALAAIIWEPKVSFTETVSNPNLLLYVTSAEYAPSSIKNVVVNGTAASITLTDAVEGNDFYCPVEFTARSISYSHQYGMTTGIHESKGWETIALPFDVDRVEHSAKGTIISFASWSSGSSAKPFWLYEYGYGGFREATAIRANTPYIISMPNNEQYLPDYCLSGTVKFSAVNAKVRKSDELQSVTNGDYTFVPNFMKQNASATCYALNVSNSLITNSSSTAGNKFVRNSRAVYPFEAYMTTATSNSKPYIAVFEDVPTGIRNVELLDDKDQCSMFNVQRNEVWYTLEGQKLSDKPANKGVYIYNGKKVVVR